MRFGLTRWHAACNIRGRGGDTRPPRPQTEGTRMKTETTRPNRKAAREARRAAKLAAQTADVAETQQAMAEADKTEALAAKVAGKAKPKKAPKEPTPKPTYQGITVRRNGQLSAKGMTCLCGCGTPTVTEEARFVSGHDAKLRKVLLAGGDMPDIVRPFFEHGEAIGGMRLIDGEIVDLKAGDDPTE